jgi:hypothetical protein
MQVGLLVSDRGCQRALVRGWIIGLAVSASTAERQKASS